MSVVTDSRWGMWLHSDNENVWKVCCQLSPSNISLC